MTTLRALARKEDQRGWARWAWCHWVRSGVTQAVSGQNGGKVRMHAACEIFTSGQLLFLGLWVGGLALPVLLYKQRQRAGHYAPEG